MCAKRLLISKCVCWFIYICLCTYVCVSVCDLLIIVNGYIHVIVALNSILDHHTTICVYLKTCLCIRCIEGENEKRVTSVTVEVYVIVYCRRGQWYYKQPRATSGGIHMVYVRNKLLTIFKVFIFISINCKQKQIMIKFFFDNVLG